MRGASNCSSIDQRKAQYLARSKVGRIMLSANPFHVLGAARNASVKRWDKCRQSIHLIWATAMRRRTKIILAVIGVAIVWPLAQIGLIAAQAQYFASGRPYCIEVSSDGFLRHRPVASLFELNGFTLRAPYVHTGGSVGFVQLTFHALLAIDAGNAVEWRNWSYWHQHFDKLTPQQARDTRLYSVECLPQADFVLKLPPLAN